MAVHQACLLWWCPSSCIDAAAAFVEVGRDGESVRGVILAEVWVRGGSKVAAE